MDVTEQLTFGLVRKRTGNLFMEQILVLEVDHKVPSLRVSSPVHRVGTVEDP